jgi:glycosyltransferase 2 family protein
VATAKGMIGRGHVPISRRYRYKPRVLADRPVHRGSWKLFAKVAVSVGLLAYLSRRVDFVEIGRFLVRVDLFGALAAIGVYLAGQVLSALKWRRLALALGFRGDPMRFVAHYFIGMFFNTFGFGTVGGDIVRAFYLAESDGRRGLALNTVVADRVSGLVVLLAIALVALVVFHHYELPAAIYWSVIALSSALLGGWRLLPWLLPKLLPQENRLRRLVEVDLAPYWDDYRLLAEVSVFSLFFHLSQIGVLVILTHALGLAVPWSYCFVFGPLVNVMAAIPVSLNGLGVREGGYVFFLAHVGVPRESAIAFALTWFAVVMLSAGIGGVVYLAHRSAPR